MAMALTPLNKEIQYWIFNRKWKKSYFEILKANNHVSLSLFQYSNLVCKFDIVDDIFHCCVMYNENIYT